MRPPDPTAPKNLADPDALAARRAIRDDPHVAPLRAMAARIAADFGVSVPAPDPLDGGVGARLLLLLETPGPAIVRTGFVSRDNPTGTAANLFRFLAEARIAREDTLIWNAVPWVIHAEGALNRAPRRSEIRAATPCLGQLLSLLPRLVVVVLAGRVAGALRETVDALRPELSVLAIPHPSPTYVCTSPDVAVRIRDGLARAGVILRTRAATRTGLLVPE